MFNSGFGGPSNPLILRCTFSNNGDSPELDGDDISTSLPDALPATTDTHPINPAV